MEYFIRLAADENFSVAAKKLGITQPTLTTAIQKIESSLGVALFDRDGRSVQINEYGKMYLETCKKVTKLYNDCTSKIIDTENGTTGTIKIGIAPSRAPSIMPDIFSVFHKKYPDIRIEIQERLTLSIEKSVELGSVDLGIMVVREEKNPLLSFIPLTTEKILVAINKNSAKSLPPYNSSFGNASIADFANLDFILLEENQLIVKQFRDACVSHDIDVNCIARCRNYDTSIALANAGIGAALITDSGIAYYHKIYPDLLFYSINDADLTRCLQLAYRKNMFLSEVLEYLIDIIKKFYEKT